jgi:hypothetical protein
MARETQQGLDRQSRSPNLTHLRTVELLNVTQDADVVALHKVDRHTLQAENTAA